MQGCTGVHMRISEPKTSHSRIDRQALSSSILVSAPLSLHCRGRSRGGKPKKLYALGLGAGELWRCLPG